MIKKRETTISWHSLLFVSKTKKRHFGLQQTKEIMCSENLISLLIYFFFNYYHVLHLRSEIVCCPFDGWIWPKFLDTCQLRENLGKTSNSKLIQTEIEQGPAGRKATTLSLDHSGSPRWLVDESINDKYWETMFYFYAGIWTSDLQFYALAFYQWTTETQIPTQNETFLSFFNPRLSECNARIHHSRYSY